LTNGGSCAQIESPEGTAGTQANTVPGGFGLPVCEALGSAARRAPGASLFRGVGIRRREVSIMDNFYRQFIPTALWLGIAALRDAFAVKPPTSAALPRLLTSAVGLRW